MVVELKKIAPIRDCDCDFAAKARRLFSRKQLLFATSVASHTKAKLRLVVP